MRTRLLVCVVAPLLAAAACTGTTPEATGSRSPEVEVSSPSPTPPPPPTAPLTGLDTTEAVMARPFLAVKIDNATAARPHAGLEKADLVYEEPVEGGITRFIAIFHSRNASTVGPVRSARLTDIDVLEQYGRVPLAYSGAAGYVLRAISRSRVISLAHGGLGSIYRRDGSRRAPHNLFSSTQGLYRAARAKNPSVPREPFVFGELLDPPEPREPASPSPVASGSPSASPAPAAWPSGASVRIPFTSSAWTAVWRYDERAGLYRRWHGSTRHRVVSGKQVTARNVVVLRADTSNRNRQAAARGTPELVLTGSGEATLLRDGVRIKGRWKRASERDMFTFTDALGRPWTFGTGVTWIELVPSRIRPTYG